MRSPKRSLRQCASRHERQERHKKPIEARLHRRAGGKEIAGAGGAQGHGKRAVILDREAARPLEHGEGSVPFIQVTDLGLQVQRAERPPPADAEYQLLLQPGRGYGLQDHPRVAGAGPEFRVNAFPDLVRAVTPGPTHVEGQLRQAVEARRHLRERIAECLFCHFLPLERLFKFASKPMKSAAEEDPDERGESGLHRRDFTDALQDPAL